MKVRELIDELEKMEQGCEIYIMEPYDKGRGTLDIQSLEYDDYGGVVILT